MAEHSDVFISYHREGGDDLALLIEMQLKQRGYSVFLDYHAIARGNWKEQILEQLSHTTDFILLVTSGALESCVKPNSYLRMEILEAKRLKINIIPVFKSGYSAPENLPPELAEVLFYQGVTFMHQYGEASLDALCRLMQSQPAGKEKPSDEARPTPKVHNAVAETAQGSSAAGTKQPLPANNPAREYRKGDVFTFGRYPQSAGGKVEPIRWIVLDQRDDGSLLLISKYALDAKPYNEKPADVTWETCTLRKWLNGDFYTGAFSAQEQEKIMPVTLENEEDPYGKEGVWTTQDRVWLLNVSEAGRFFDDDDARMCAPTKYAAAQGAKQHWHAKCIVDGVGSCWWWLRSPGRGYELAAGVTYHGFVSFFGDRVFHSVDRGVRPVVAVLP